MRRYNGKHWDAPFRLSLFIELRSKFFIKNFFCFLHEPSKHWMCTQFYLYLSSSNFFFVFLNKKKFVSYKLLARSTKENVIFFSSLYIYVYFFQLDFLRLTTCKTEKRNKAFSIVCSVGCDTCARYGVWFVILHIYIHIDTIRKLSTCNQVHEFRDFTHKHYQPLCNWIFIPYTFTPFGKSTEKFSATKQNDKNCMT